jgi:glycosyltransferase involved in cell wall biosynthesis
MEPKEVKVTIGLPTYNRSGLLPDCIKSVLEQSYRNWELIIADDNSSDDTPKVAEELAKLDSRIRYFRQNSRVLQPKNRNTICSLSNSDLIFFTEDDVLMDKNCLANLVTAYKELSPSKRVAAVTPRMINPNDASSLENKSDAIVTISKWTGLSQIHFDTDCSGRVQIPDAHACSLIAKEVWKQVGGYDEIRYKGTCFREETDFYFRLRGKGYGIYFEPKAIIYHLKYRSGGCHSSPLKDDYYYARNQILFLLRFFKFRSTYMIPMFLLYLANRLIGRRFRL